MRSLAMPQVLYHGTRLNLLASFQQQLLNPQYWKHSRDFGAGFYTTASLSQAKRWAKHVVGEEEQPCVLQVELLSMPRIQRTKVFLSPSLEWATYIFKHRTLTTPVNDPCGSRHAQLIVGPCADGDTGLLAREAVQSRKNMEWFHSSILKSKKGRRLDAEQLDSQIVFSDPVFESHLKLKGYYVQWKGAWRYAEIQIIPGSGSV